MAEIETMKVKDDNPQGFRVINKADFMKGRHAPWVAPEKKEPEKDAGK